MTSELPSNKEPRVVLQNHKNNDNTNNKKNPPVVISCTDETFCSLIDKRLTPEFAFMRGLLKIKGPMKIALKVKILLDLASANPL